MKIMSLKSNFFKKTSVLGLLLLTFIFFQNCSKQALSDNQNIASEDVLTERAGILSRTIPIYRFYGGGNHFLTATRAEGVRAGYAFEGVGFQVFVTNVPGTIPIYRCYRTNDHYVSNDSNCEGGGTNEGLYGYVFSGYKPSTGLIYRCYNPTTGDHLTTLRTSECTKLGMVIEGGQGYAPLNKQ